MRAFIVRVTVQPTQSRLQAALASALLATALSSPAIAQGQPAPGLAPLQPKVPLQPQLPTDRKPITIEGDKLNSPITPRVPTAAVVKKPDIALESITLAEAHKTASGATRVSFRVNAKNVGNGAISHAQVACGAGALAPELGNGYWAPISETRFLTSHGHISHPGDTHVIAFAVILDPSYVTANKWGQIICDLKPNRPEDDINGGNNRATSSVRFPDGPALQFPIWSR